jgi:hypothetical protein
MFWLAKDQEPSEWGISISTTSAYSERPVPHMIRTVADYRLALRILALARFEWNSHGRQAC